MLVIDTHSHLGESRYTESAGTESELMANMERWGVDVSLVMPFPQAAPSSQAVHDRIHRLIGENPGRFFGIVDLNPALPDEEFWKEAERCFGTLGFVGIKMHTIGHPCNPLSRFAVKVFEVAKQFKVPVIAHTGTGSPNSVPSLFIARARQFPEVSIVLAHAGMNYYAADAVVAAQVCDNILLEPSWCSIKQVREMIAKIGSERVLMGSDTPLNVPVELTKYRNIGLTDAQLEDCLGRTAIQVFRLPLTP